MSLFLAGPYKGLMLLMQGQFFPSALACWVPALGYSHDADPRPRLLLRRLRRRVWRPPPPPLHSLRARPLCELLHSHHRKVPPAPGAVVSLLPRPVLAGPDSHDPHGLYDEWVVHPATLSDSRAGRLDYRRPPRTPDRTTIVHGHHGHEQVPP